MLEQYRKAGKPIPPQVEKMAGWLDSMEEEAGQDVPMVKPGALACVSVCGREKYPWLHAVDNGACGVGWCHIVSWRGRGSRSCERLRSTGCKLASWLLA